MIYKAAGNYLQSTNLGLKHLRVSRLINTETKTIKRYSKTNFPNNQYEGYSRSYSVKDFSYCLKDKRTWKYGMWIDMEL